MESSSAPPTACVLCGYAAHGQALFTHYQTTHFIWRVCCPLCNELHTKQTALRRHLLSNHFQDPRCDPLCELSEREWFYFCPDPALWPPPLAPTPTDVRKVALHLLVQSCGKTVLYKEKRIYTDIATAIAIFSKHPKFQNRIAAPEVKTINNDRSSSASVQKVLISQSQSSAGSTQPPPVVSTLQSSAEMKYIKPLGSSMKPVGSNSGSRLAGSLAKRFSSSSSSATGVSSAAAAGISNNTGNSFDQSIELKLKSSRNVTDNKVEPKKTRKETVQKFEQEKAETISAQKVEHNKVRKENCAKVEKEKVTKEKTHKTETARKEEQKKDRKESTSTNSHQKKSSKETDHKVEQKKVRIENCPRVEAKTTKVEQKKIRQENSTANVELENLTTGIAHEVDRKKLRTETATKDEQKKIQKESASNEVDQKQIVRKVTGEKAERKKTRTESRHKVEKKRERKESELSHCSRGSASSSGRHQRSGSRSKATEPHAKSSRTASSSSVKSVSGGHGKVRSVEMESENDANPDATIPKSSASKEKGKPSEKFEDKMEKRSTTRKNSHSSVVGSKLIACLHENTESLVDNRRMSEESRRSINSDRLTAMEIEGPMIENKIAPELMLPHCIPHQNDCPLDLSVKPANKVQVKIENVVRVKLEPGITVKKEKLDCELICISDSSSCHSAATFRHEESPPPLVRPLPHMHAGRGQEMSGLEKVNNWNTTPPEANLLVIRPTTCEPVAMNYVPAAMNLGIGAADPDESSPCLEDLLGSDGSFEEGNNSHPGGDKVIDMDVCQSSEDIDVENLDCALDAELGESGGTPVYCEYGQSIGGSPGHCENNENMEHAYSEHGQSIPGTPLYSEIGTPTFSESDQNMDRTPAYSESDQNMDQTPTYSEAGQSNNGTPLYDEHDEIPVAQECSNAEPADTQNLAQKSRDLPKTLPKIKRLSNTSDASKSRKSTSVKKKSASKSKASLRAKTVIRSGSVDLELKSPLADVHFDRRQFGSDFRQGPSFANIAKTGRRTSEVEAGATETGEKSDEDHGEDNHRRRSLKRSRSRSIDHGAETSPVKRRRIGSSGAQEDRGKVEGYLGVNPWKMKMLGVRHNYFGFNLFFGVKQFKQIQAYYRVSVNLTDAQKLALQSKKLSVVNKKDTYISGTYDHVCIGDDLLDITQTILQDHMFIDRSAIIMITLRLCPSLPEFKRAKHTRGEALRKVLETSYNYPDFREIRACLWDVQEEQNQVQSHFSKHQTEQSTSSEAYGGEQDTDLRVQGRDYQSEQCVRNEAPDHDPGRNSRRTSRDCNLDRTAPEQTCHRDQDRYSRSQSREYHLERLATSDSATVPDNRCQPAVEWQRQNSLQDPRIKQDPGPDTHRSRPSHQPSHSASSPDDPVVLFRRPMGRSMPLQGPCLIYNRFEVSALHSHQEIRQHLQERDGRTGTLTLLLPDGFGSGVLASRRRWDLVPQRIRLQLAPGGACPREVMWPPQDWQGMSGEMRLRQLLLVAEQVEQSWFRDKLSTSPAALYDRYRPLMLPGTEPPFIPSISEKMAAMQRRLGEQAEIFYRRAGRWDLISQERLAAREEQLSWRRDGALTLPSCLLEQIDQVPLVEFDFATGNPVDTECIDSWDYQARQMFWAMIPENMYQTSTPTTDLVPMSMRPGSTLTRHVGVQVNSDFSVSHPGPTQIHTEYPGFSPSSTIG